MIGEAQTADGGCRCGAIRYRPTGPAMSVGRFDPALASGDALAPRDV